MKEFQGNKKAWQMRNGDVKIKHGDQTVVLSEEQYNTIGELFK